MTLTQLARILRAGEQAVPTPRVAVTNETLAAVLRAMRLAAIDEAAREREGL
jgi:hypothetical protein